MSGFSAGAAIGAGFRLIGRQPAAFLAWTLVLLLIGVVPMFWAMSQVFGMVGEIARLAPADSAAMPPASVLQMQARLMQAQPIMLLSGTVSGTLVIAAVFRAVLDLQERSFFHLRLGS